MVEIDETKQQNALSIVYDLLDRYQNLDQEKMLPIVAIRLLCIRHGYGKLMKAVAELGVDSVVLAAKGQLMNIAKMWTRMVELQPPPDEIREGVMENIDTVRRATANMNVNARLYAQLTRMALREQWLKFHKEPKAEGETVQ